MFFDAIGTTGLSGNDYVGASFTWDYDSTNVNPGEAHKRTRGFATAHVYDVPGTYTVAVSVRDLGGAIGSTTVTLAVTAMSGTKYYASSSGNGTVCSITAPCSFSTVISHAATNNSLLLRRGDTFTLTGETDFDVSGPFLVGAYTDPGASSSVAPTLKYTAAGGNIFVLGYHGGSSMSMQDLHIISTNHASSGIWLYSSNNLVERVELEGYGDPAGGSIGINTFPISDPSFIVDCNLHDFAGYGVYGQTPTHWAVWGTKILNYTAQDHGVRVQGGRSTGTLIDPGTAGPSYFAENDIEPATVIPSGQLASFDSTAFRGDDTNIVYIDNVATSTTSFTPQNLQVTEHISNILYEGNRVSRTATPLSIRAQNVVIRNNIISSIPANGGSSVAIDIEGHPNLPANYVTGIVIHNNTLYANLVATNPTVKLINILTTTGAITAKNNIFHNTEMAGAEGPSRFIATDGAATIVEDHNLYYSPNDGSLPALTGIGDITGNPSYVSTDITNASGFTLSSSSSPACNVGATVPNYVDIVGTPRPQAGAIDMGAFEFKP